MGRLLPSTQETSVPEDTGPRVIGVNDADADNLLSAMQSETARNLLTALHEEPAAPSELANQVDTSLQNAQYHLSNLEDAGVVEVIDTVYSEKGREMNVYAPADKPLVVVAGQQEETAGLKATLTSLLGGLGVLGIVSFIIQRLTAEPTPLGGTGAAPAGGGDSGDGGGVGVMDAATSTPVEEAASGFELVSFLTEPGVLFFTGGAIVLVSILVFRYLR